MSDFTKKIIADLIARRLSTGDFVAVIAANAADANEARVAVDPKAVTSWPMRQYLTHTEAWRDGLGNSSAVIAQLMEDACSAAAAGHVFDMGSLSALRELSTPAFDAHAAGRLVVPYSDCGGTLFIIRAVIADLVPENPADAWGEVPFAVHIRADSTGAPLCFTSFVLTVQDSGLALQPMSCSIQHGDPDRPALARVLPTTLNPDGSMDRLDMDQQRQLAFLLGLAALLAVNDDRLELRRDVPAEALNKSRAKSGKPPLPSVWRMPSAAALSSYITKLGIKGQGPHASKGGTHASPVQHERRGHLRRLSSGRITKVRSSLVGGLNKHLTRTRAFYEVKA